MLHAAVPGQAQQYSAAQATRAESIPQRVRERMTGHREHLPGSVARIGWTGSSRDRPFDEFHREGPNPGRYAGWLSSGLGIGVAD
jgi:hypothetical protein